MPHVLFLIVVLPHFYKKARKNLVIFVNIMKKIYLFLSKAIFCFRRRRGKNTGYYQFWS